MVLIYFILYNLYYKIYILCIYTIYILYIQGAFHDNFPGFSGFRFRRKLTRTKIKAQEKQANITGVQYNSRGSTGSGVNFVLSFYYFLFVLTPTLFLSPLRTPAIAAAAV